MSHQSASLEELIEGIIARVFARMFVARPGRVERYDAQKQQADIRPVFIENARGASGEAIKERPALINNVPVVFPATGAGYLSFGLSVGDTVLLIYLDRSLDRWKSLGGEVDPVDVRRHHPSDAIAVVGLHAFNAPLDGVSDTHTILTAKPGAEVRLGDASPSDAIALASRVNQQLNDLKTAISSWVVVTGDGGAALQTALATWVLDVANVGSSKVKVQP